MAQIKVSRRRRVLVDLARIFSTVHAEARSTAQFWELLFVSTAFTSIGPMLFVLWLYSTDRIADLDMSVRSERERVFGVFVLFYWVGTGMLWLIHAPLLLVATMGGYATASLVVQYITRYWKISTHALGITASLAALVHLYGQQPLPFLVLIPIVGWSRVYLKAHTTLQVVGGTVLGAACVMLFYRIFRV